MMRFLSLIGLVLLMGFKATYAQTLPPNRIEQDACGALAIGCTRFSVPYSYVGVGQQTDLVNTPCGAGEGNSMWLRLNINTPGTIQFTIIPNVASDDYDFAVVNLTNGDCNNILPSNVVRCNFNNNQPVSNQGRVGLNPSGQLNYVQAGTSGQNFVRHIDAIAGQVYLIMINNFGANGNVSSGFTIDFAGSTASFNNMDRPKLVSVESTCFSVSNILVNLNKDILCSSIANNGSDFTIAGTTITSATGINCNNSNQGYTHQLSINVNPALGPGTYVLKAKTGTDNNTLLDLCEVALALPDSIIFTVSPDNRVVLRDSLAGCGFVEFNGKTYTQSGTIVDTVRNALGCDSIYATMKITVYPNDPIIQALEYNGCDSVVFRNTVYKASTIVRDSFQNYLGCDSLVIEHRIVIQNFELNITADPPEPVLTEYVALTTSANIPDYQVNAWLPQALFPRQTTIDNSFFIQQSDTITVVATSPLGCIDTAKIYIKADTLKPFVFMPNAFSPNNDGLNDFFEAYFYNKSGYTIQSFRVHDRWGKLVYIVQRGKKVSWDGNYNNGKPAVPGVYFWYIDVEFIDGTKSIYKGDVTLLR